MRLLVLASATGAAAWWSVAAIRRHAVRLNLLDRPCARSAHVRPVPRLGGLPMTLVVALAMIGGWWLGEVPPVVAGLVAISLGVAAVGLTDDLRGLPALPRLAVHFLAAGLAVWLAGPLAIFTGGPLGPSLGAVAAPLTILWIAWFINAFNFMDGSDGIAGVQVAVAGAAWVAAGLVGSAPGGVWIGVVLVAVAAGFLWHNWSPATIFMGDAGATALGFWLAALPLLTPGPAEAACGLLALWPFAFDATATLLQRLPSGEVLAAGHQRHYYQRLVRSGWSHSTVALLYGAWAAVCAAAGLAASLGLVGIGVVTTALLGGAALLLLAVRVREQWLAGAWESLDPVSGRSARSGREVR